MCMKCEHCGREFSRKESLSRHVNYTHLHKTQIHSRAKCGVCGADVAKMRLVPHLAECHGLSLGEAVAESEIASRKKFRPGIPAWALRLYLAELNKGVTKWKDVKFYERQFSSFYDIVTSV